MSDKQLNDLIKKHQECECSQYDDEEIKIAVNDSIHSVINRLWQDRLLTICPKFTCGVCDRECPELVNTNLDICFDCMGTE